MVSLKIDNCPKFVKIPQINQNKGLKKAFLRDAMVWERYGV